MLAETYEVLAVSSSGEELHKVAEREGVRTCAIPMERHIAPLKDLIALIRLIILFRKEKPQIVHSLTQTRMKYASTVVVLFILPMWVNILIRTLATAVSYTHLTLPTTERV